MQHMTETSATDPWMNIHQAAKYLGIDVVTLRAFRRTRGLPAYRIGHRTYRFRQTELDSWVRSHRA